MSDSGFVPENILQLARQYQTLGQLQKAADLYQKVLQEDPGSLLALEGLAQLAQESGNLHKAQQLWQRACDQNPDHPRFALQLGDVYADLNQWQEAADSYHSALTLGLQAEVDVEPLYTRLGQAKQALGLVEEALIHYQEALRLNPSSVTLLAAIGYVYSCLGEWAEAVQAYQQALHLDPRLADVHFALGNVLLVQSAFPEASRAFQQAIHLDPSHQTAVAHWIIAARESRESEKVSTWLDYDHLIQLRCPDPPEGYASLEAFNTQLAEKLLRHPSMAWEPPVYYTCGGLQSQNLLWDKPLIHPVLELLRPAVTHYLETLPADADHPLQWNRPADLSLSGIWAVSLEPQGYQRLHLQDPAWLSGIYYVQVDKPEDTEKGGGSLEFARPQQNFPVTLPVSTRQIQPYTGLLVLFPAYFYHHTPPWPPSGRCISLCFTVAGQLEGAEHCLPL
ncbi:MAG: tetratricopeptide repeat protein [Synechococcaceae cyanobacterium SM2_3_1]|nr:tetratricopeptide repeat protein [Synechococcaceae cyanobacterium SM2_3_1]